MNAGNKPTRRAPAKVNRRSVKTVSNALASDGASMRARERTRARSSAGGGGVGSASGRSPQYARVSPYAAPEERSGGLISLVSAANPRLLALAAAGVLLVVLAAVLLARCTANASGGAGASDANAGASEPTEARVSFAAVGDNLPNAGIGAYADACAGEVGDGAYDYTPIFANIKPYIESADLAYMKQETHLGGDDIGPRGWPSFNTTDAMADAVVDAGFDMVASASNHSYDWGYFGAVEHSRAVWDAQPVAFTGTAANAEQAAEIATVEREGITFALLDYTYGVNGFGQADLPSYAVNFIDEERIGADVARAREVADVVMVAMHWGTENLMDTDEEQLRLAQFLADLDVDVVLGSHPHVIGPLAWVEGASGHETLVAYSLGNFLSNHETPALKNELEGMLSCDFVREGESGAVHIENVAWTPLVNHTDQDGSASIYALRDYTPELASSHTLLSQLDDPLGQLEALTRQVIGEGFEIRI